VQPGRPRDGAPPERDAETHQAEQAEDVGQQRVAEVEAAAQEVDARPLLEGDQGGGHELGEEAVEDQQVGHTRQRIAEGSAMSEDLDEQAPQALSQPIGTQLRSAQPPEADAPEHAPAQRRHRRRSEQVDQRSRGDVPVDLAGRLHAVPSSDRTGERPRPLGKGRTGDRRVDGTPQTNSGPASTATSAGEAAAPRRGRGIGSGFKREDLATWEVALRRPAARRGPRPTSKP
jgi:hypothetical protein